MASGNVSRSAFGALGIPSVVIMALGGAGAPGAQPASSATTAGPSVAAKLAEGRKLYSQICTSCHGPEGDLVAGHELSTLKKRRNLADPIAFIKKPKAPM